MGLCLSAAACVSLQEPSGLRSYYLGIDTASGPVDVFVREEGQGPPILMLHGFGASSYTWRFLQPALAQSHRTIAIDLKGFGRSDKPLDRRYSLFDQADIVERVIEKLRLRDVVLVGHSYGGGIALALTVNEQTSRLKRIKKLVLIDSMTYRQGLPYFLAFLRTPVVSHLGLLVVPPEVQSQAALEFAYRDNDKITWDAVREYAQPLYSLGGKYALIRSAEQIVPPEIDSYTDRFRAIDIPTLILWCEGDKIVRLKNAVRLNRDIKNSQLHLIKNCGHAPQEETPDETLGALRPFL